MSFFSSLGLNYRSIGHVLRITVPLFGARYVTGTMIALVHSFHGLYIHPAYPPISVLSGTVGGFVFQVEG